MNVALTFEVPEQWEHDPAGYVQFLVMQVRPNGHNVIGWVQT